MNYNTQHKFYCGVDLHARTMFTHVLDHGGATVFARDLPAGPEAFLNAVAPFRQGLIVGCECRGESVKGESVTFRVVITKQP